ncbi:hypothetical protein [Amycolatopsis rifamycinica]|uniref:Biopolymer transporter Tol n=1 Tax=Amycolatopsis rifamycinica TaxID=287986 RepID=A0A066U9U2_9PSEU|nr:hypothetical protein [Amycolatopsis rifamycinica]KDN24181.1 hypothetical protein DV20_00365 [Amycolatopsis rifamycinica]
MPEHTPDGRYIVVHGRRWRATDPEIPEDVRDRLQKHLMAARRVQDRARVQTAKVALGERGEPWWEQTSEQRRVRWESGLAELDQPTG